MDGTGHLSRSRRVRRVHSVHRDEGIRPSDHAERQCLSAALRHPVNFLRAIPGKAIAQSVRGGSGIGFSCYLREVNVSLDARSPLAYSRPDRRGWPCAVRGHTVLAVHAFSLQHWQVTVQVLDSCSYSCCWAHYSSFPPARKIMTPPQPSSTVRGLLSA